MEYIPGNWKLRSFYDLPMFEYRIDWGIFNGHAGLSGQPRLKNTLNGFHGERDGLTAVKTRK